MKTPLRVRRPGPPPDGWLLLAYDLILPYRVDGEWLIWELR
jgi:hypothetical protein